MKKYGILINSQNGIPVTDTGYREIDIPPDSVIPSNTEIVVFTDNSPDFDLLHAFFFGDPNRLTVEYKLATSGGVVYDLVTKTFTFHKQDFTINLEQLKTTRNSLLIASDKYMQIPDLPQDIVSELLAYRTALRNITTKVGTEWQTVFDIQWPEFPEKLLLKPTIPPQV